MLRTVSEESPLRRKPLGVDAPPHIGEHAAYLEQGYNDAINKLLSLGVLDAQQQPQQIEEDFRDPELE